MTTLPDAPTLFDDAPSPVPSAPAVPAVSRTLGVYTSPGTRIDSRVLRDEAPPVENPRHQPVDRRPIAERFREFHEENPEVFAELAEMALAAKAAGVHRLGMSLLVGRVRWERMITTSSDDGFKVNNDYLASYARLLMATYPVLQGMFELRQRKGTA